MKNMKRFVSLLLVVAMLASLPVMASAAVTHDHEHHYVEELHAATCTKQGYTLYKCSLCDASYKAKYVPSLHEYNPAATPKYVAKSGSVAAHWEYMCSKCNKTIFSVADNDCSTDKVETVTVTVTEKDEKGSVKKTVTENGVEKSVEYASSTGEKLTASCFASGGSTESTITAFEGGWYTKENQNERKLYSDPACTTEVSKKAIAEKVGYNGLNPTSLSYSLSPENKLTAWNPLLWSWSAQLEVASVTTTSTDGNGNKKTEVTGGTTTCIDRDGNPIDEKYFACGGVIDRSEESKTDVSYEFVADKEASHVNADMKTDTIKVGGLTRESCLTGGKCYTVTTCGGCGMKYYDCQDLSDAHKFPTTGNYEKNGVKYTVGTPATTTKNGYAYRKCDDCGMEETVVIPRLDATYPAYTTNEIVAVYNEANAGNAQTVSGLKIGNLPAGATVLVVETKNGFSKIVSKQEEAWVLTSKLTKVKAQDEKVDCAHGTLDEFYEKEATCQFAKMKTSLCKECKKYYVFTSTGAANAHTDQGKHAWIALVDTTEQPFKIENDTAWKITKQPTETADGEMERVCAVCGYKEIATGADTTDAKYAYKNVGILKATGTVNTKAYVNVAVAEIYDTFDSDKKLEFYAVQGSNVTVTGYAIDKTWAYVKGNDGREGYIKTSQLKLDASSNMSATYDGALAYAIVADGAQMKVRLSYSETSSVLSTVASGNAIVIFEEKEVSGSIWGRITSKTADKWVKLGKAKGGKLDTSELNGLKSYAPLLRTYEVTSPTATLTDAIAKGHVTSTINLNIRESASVSSKALGGFKPAEEIYLYEVKTVNGVQWAKVQGMKDSHGTIEWKQITKADLENTNKKLVSGWVCMTYVALDTEIGTPGTAAPAAAPTGTVTTGGIALNVRKSYDVYADKVGALPNGTKVTIYQTAEAKNGVKWGRISQNSVEGWVCMQYVNLDATTGTTGSTAAAAKLNAQVANCATAVNVRNKSDISGTQIAKIPVGTRIAITKTQNGWGYVDGKGWVYLEYVAFDTGALEALNSVAPAPGVETSITTYTNVSVPALVVRGCAVYASANTSSDVLMRIYERDSIQVVDRTIVSGKLWFKISEGSVTGWIVSDVDVFTLFGSLQITNISMQALTGTTSVITNVYAQPSVDSNIRTVLGAGSKFTVNAGNEHHFTEGIYAWAELAGGGWIQLHNTKLDATPNASFLPSYSETPAIVATVTDATGAILYKEHATTSTALVTLSKDTSFTVLDWYYDASGRTWGKVTQGQYTGWLILNGTGDKVYAEQVSVGGAVATETLNLYKTAGETTDVQLVLRKGDKVTVTERRLIGNAVWGRMVAEKDTSKRQLWANLAGVTLDGQKTQSTTTTTTTTVTTPTVTTPATVTIGVVVGNFDKVNVRQEPHVSSALVATVKKGDQVRVSEQKMSDGANWGKIDQGWIAMQYVSLKSETIATNVTTNVTTGTTIMTSVPSGAIAVGFTSIDNLAVRSSAGVAMPQVGTLAKGSNVVISEITAANGLYWGKTDAGWICMSYVVNTAVGTAGSGTAGTIARCNYTVNVRATAGTNSAITGKIMVGSPVQIFETTTYSGELWGRTNLGWVAMQYVA